MSNEVTAERLSADGEVPRALHGLYARNSPNPQFTPPGRYHWFDGDGMVHGLRLRDGQASYLNRFIRTAGFEAEAAAGRALWAGILEPPAPGAPSALKDTANTDLVFHRGRLWALWWLSGKPYQLDPTTLATVGPMDISGSVAAHAKVDPRTQELVFFDFSLFRKPYLRYGVIDAAGALVRLEAIDTPQPHILHDLALTERFSLLMDFPLGWDAAKLKLGKRRIAFDKGTPSRFGLIPRRGVAADVRWFEAKPCYMYHAVNAYEAGDEVVLLGCRVDELIPEQPSTSDTIARLDVIELVPHLYEWRFNLKTGATTERQLDDVATEFPRINDAYLGVKNRFSYHPRIAPRAELMFDGVLKYDLSGIGSTSWNAPPGWYVGEPSFAAAPRPTSEDDGWLVTFGSDASGQTSAAFIVDAREMREVARVHLPQRMPLGFHGRWCPGV